MKTYTEIRQDIEKSENPKAAAQSYITLMKNMVNSGQLFPQEAWTLATDLIKAYAIEY